MQPQLPRDYPGRSEMMCEQRQDKDDRYRYA